MKIIQAHYGKVTSKNISGIAIKPETIVEGKKFTHFQDPFPGKPKVLWVLVEKDNTQHQFVFKSSEIVEFDFSTDNCPNCKGTNKVPSTSIEIKDGKRVETKFEASCYACMGYPVSKQEAIQITKRKEAEAKKWCKCEGDTDAYYVPDTARMKHHWKCKCCKKITQIG